MTASSTLPNLIHSYPLASWFIRKLAARMASISTGRTGFMIALVIPAPMALGRKATLMPLAEPVVAAAAAAHSPCRGFPNRSTRSHQTG